MRVARFVICLFLSLALLGQHSANGQDIVKGLLNEYQYAIFVGTGASTSQSFHEMVLFFTPDQPNNVIHMAAAGRSAGWMATGFNGNNEAAMISSTATSTKVIRGTGLAVDCREILAKTGASANPALNPIPAALFWNASTVRDETGPSTWTIVRYSAAYDITAGNVKAIVTAGRKTVTSWAKHDPGFNRAVYVDMTTGTPLTTLTGPVLNQPAVTACNATLCKAPGGSCDAFYCICADGYSGPNCDQRVDLACSDPADGEFEFGPLTLFANSEDPKAIDFWYTVNNATNTISIAVRAETTGWIAFGVASDSTTPMMVGGEAVVAWIDDSTRAAQAKGYRLVAKDSSAFTDITTDLGVSAISGCQGSTHTVVRFSRNLSGGSISNPIVGGVNTGFLTSSGTADWNAAAVGSNSAHASDARAFGSFDVNSPTVQGGAPAPIRLAHGALMFIGWGVFLQFGALFARYAKRFPNAIWFKIHRPFQTVGYIIALIGFILAIVMTHPAHYAVQPHTGLGLAVMVLGSLQMSIAMFRPEPTKKGEKPTIWRRLFEFQHWYVGRVALILAVITIFFGLQAIGAGVGLYIAYGVLVAIEFIAYVVLEILRLMRRESDERGCY